MAFTNLGVKRTGSGASAVRGGTRDQRALARSLIEAIDGDAITSVKIGPLPSGVRSRPSLEISGDTWLTIHVRANGSEPVADLTAAWKAGLLAGAFRDAAKARGLATVLGYTGLIEYPPGRSPLGDSTPREAGSGISGGFVHDVSAESAETLAAQIQREYERIAKVAGISQVTVSFIDATELAVIVDVRASKPLRALAESEFIRSLRVEGVLLRVRTATGKPFAVRSFTIRVNGGATWGGGAR